MVFMILLSLAPLALPVLAKVWFTSTTKAAVTCSSALDCPRGKSCFSDASWSSAASECMTFSECDAACALVSKGCENASSYVLSKTATLWCTDLVNSTGDNDYDPPGWRVTNDLKIAAAVVLAIGFVYIGVFLHKNFCS
jgi:hypothetical protein